jgi:hypothetical protein
MLVSLRSNEPKRQSARVVARPAGCGRISHTKRTFLTCFLPAAPLHDHANQHSDRLTKSLATTRMNAAQKSIDGGFRLQFSHNSGQGRSVVMNLRFFHASLPINVIEKRQRRVKRFSGFRQDIRKGTPLTIRQEFIASYRYCH